MKEPIFTATRALALAAEGFKLKNPIELKYPKHYVDTYFSPLAGLVSEVLDENGKAYRVRFHNQGTSAMPTGVDINTGELVGINNYGCVVKLNQVRYPKLESARVVPEYQLYQTQYHFQDYSKGILVSNNQLTASASDSVFGYEVIGTTPRLTVSQFCGPEIINLALKEVHRNYDKNLDEVKAVSIQLSFEEVEKVYKYMKSRKALQAKAVRDIAKDSLKRAQAFAKEGADNLKYVKKELGRAASKTKTR